jgi:hypothetical protein
MVTEAQDASASPEQMVDLLWNRYRKLAEKTLDDAPPASDADTKRSAQGVMSLFVANCITRWVDRIEREPDAHRRKELINLLLGV